MSFSAVRVLPTSLPTCVYALSRTGCASSVGQVCWSGSGCGLSGGGLTGPFRLRRGWMPLAAHCASLLENISALPNVMDLSMVSPSRLSFTGLRTSDCVCPYTPGSLPARAAQDRAALELIDHVTRCLLVERRDPARGIAERLGVNPARMMKNRLAEIIFERRFSQRPPRPED